MTEESQSSSQKPFASPTSEEEFALARSHKASELAYDLSKATGQACLLINGGAATAVIALLAKEHTEPIIGKLVPWSLSAYSLGVISSAFLLFATMRRAESWNYFWYRMYFTDEPDLARGSERSAAKWEGVMTVAFILSIIFFLLGSLLVGFGLLPVH